MILLILLFVSQVLASNPQVCLDDAETCYIGSWLSTSTGSQQVGNE